MKYEQKNQKDIDSLTERTSSEQKQINGGNDILISNGKDDDELCHTKSTGVATRRTPLPPPPPPPPIKVEP